MTEKIIFTITTIFLVLVLIAVGLISEYADKLSSSKDKIESTYLGEVEKCSLYKIKVNRIPPTLLWRCHD
jgi:hypothetical protein